MTAVLCLLGCLSAKMLGQNHFDEPNHFSCIFWLFLHPSFFLASWAWVELPSIIRVIFLAQKKIVWQCLGVLQATTTQLVPWCFFFLSDLHPKSTWQGQHICMLIVFLLVSEREPKRVGIIKKQNSVGHFKNKAASQHTAGSRPANR